MILDAHGFKVRRSFSNAAARYDQLSGLHRQIGEQLLGRVCANPCVQQLLDVGMGTGWLMRELRSVFPSAVIVGLDAASGMVARARSCQGALSIVQADAAHLPFQDDSFDLIVSNLAYQWVPDLEGAFRQCREVLIPHGRLCLSMFGRGTFPELFSALESVGGKRRDGLLPAAHEIIAAVQNAGFIDPAVSANLIKIRFPDMFGLVAWIKGIGANVLPARGFVGRDLLRKANEHYKRCYPDENGVYATLEIIWVEAMKGTAGS